MDLLSRAGIPRFVHTTEPPSLAGHPMPPVREADWETKKDRTGRLLCPVFVLPQAYFGQSVGRGTCIVITTMGAPPLGMIW